MYVNFLNNYCAYRTCKIKIIFLLFTAEKLTPFEEMIEKQKEKKKAKKLEKKKKRAELEENNSDNEYSSDDVPSDIDMNDPYFAEEFDNKDFKKKTKKKGNITNDINNGDSEKDKRKQAELELLLDDDDNKAHFSLKKIQDAENETKSKKKRQKYKRKDKEDANKGDIPDFEINVDDDRFSALFSSHHYNIDPTDPNYKKTKAMEKLIQEKLKRRPAENESKDYEIEPKKSRKDPAIAVLVNNIKRKTGNLDLK